jgi:hypothetical protein
VGGIAFEQAGEGLLILAGTATLSAVMRNLKKPAPEGTAKTAAQSGLVIATAAMIVAQSAMLSWPTSHRAIRHASVTARAVAPAQNPIYEMGGILGVAGASVLIVAWLQRQASRAVVSILLPSECGASTRTRVPPCRARKASISHHTGGLYGP